MELLLRVINYTEFLNKNGDVYVGMNGGFAGNISNLWYYDHALGTSMIEKIASDGPNLNIIFYFISKKIK